jgi:hypothetical protein
VAARHVSNQFEWVMHAPLAVKAGVSPQAIEALRQGVRPRRLAPDEEDALDFAQELLNRHGISDPTYQSALVRWGERGVVELTTLLGYFVMVSWLMNVARTPAPAGRCRAGPRRLPVVVALARAAVGAHLYRRDRTDVGCSVAMLLPGVSAGKLACAWLAAWPLEGRCHMDAEALL